MNDSDADLSRSWKAYRPTVCPSSGMEIDQRQKDVCPPGQAGQSGKDAHILVAHGESPRAVSITLQPTSGGARFNRASNILQRGNIFSRHRAVGLLGGLFFIWRRRPPSLSPSSAPAIAGGVLGALRPAPSGPRSPRQRFSRHWEPYRKRARTAAVAASDRPRERVYEWTSWGPHGNAVAISEIWNSAPKIEIPISGRCFERWV
jgi:hypothetical protein